MLAFPAQLRKVSVWVICAVIQFKLPSRRDVMALQSGGRAYYSPLLNSP
jgi:hypothetical protein